MVVDGGNGGRWCQRFASSALICTRRYLRLSFTWCERSDLLQTFNISWLLNNLHHHPVRVGWLPLSWLAH